LSSKPWIRIGYGSGSVPINTDPQYWDSESIRLIDSFFVDAVSLSVKYCFFSVQHNVGYASTCNSVGQTAGYFMGYVLFMALESYGLVTLPGLSIFFVGSVLFTERGSRYFAQEFDKIYR
jgi:hypothetical protein